LAFTSTLQALQAHARRGLFKRTAVRTLAVLGGLAVLSLFSIQTGTGSAHAATYLRYQRGLYIDQGWLCYGWSNGTYHCTHHWYRDSAGNLVSLNQAWVPTGRGVAAYRPTGGGAASRPAAGGAVYHPVNVSYGYSPAPAGISQWAYTGHPAYAMSDYRGDPNAAFFGSCTWYAQYRRMDEPLMRLGNAAQWAWNAPRFGLPTGSVPRVGATVVFQPGVQGASPAGHAGHVEAVYANGWFLESGMSVYWNGGGWGRVSFVYAHAGYGVSFIY
jgi:surface antigen